MRIIAITVLLVPVIWASLAFAHYEEAHLVASDGGADDRLGISVAIEGNIAVAGAYQNDANALD